MTATPATADPLIPPAGARRGFAGQPRGLGPLFFTELWERFSYYGMRALLIYFMIAPVSSGGLGFATAKAGIVYGTYTMSVYLLAIPGGYLADNFIGSWRAVVVGGSLIALGHFTLAVPAGPAFFGGLGLIVVGTGLLKPNISSMVGGLYATEDGRRDSGFSIFYMGINLGAFSGPLITGWLAQSDAFKRWLAQWGFLPAHSWHWGFAAAGFGMLLGLAVFLVTGRPLAALGRRPSAGARPWRPLALVGGGAAGVLALVLLSDVDPRFTWIRYGYVVVPVLAILWFASRGRGDDRRLAATLMFSLAALVFWAIYEQAGSTIALFGDQLTRTQVLGYAFPSAWYQSVNSVFVILLAPVFAWLWVRLGSRQPSAPFKFTLGLAVLAASFLLMVPAARLTAAGRVSPWWIVGLFLLQTIGELLVSPVGLSAMTRLAPRHLVGVVMGVWFLASALGNQLAGVLAGDFTSTDSAALAGFFLHQAAWVGAAAVVFLLCVPWVKRLMRGER